MLAELACVTLMSHPFLGLHPQGQSASWGKHAAPAPATKVPITSLVSLQLVSSAKALSDCVVSIFALRVACCQAQYLGKYLAHLISTNHMSVGWRDGASYNNHSQNKFCIS